MRSHGFRRYVASCLVVTSLQPMFPAYASMVSNAEFLSSGSATVSTPTLDEALASPELRDRLIALGVDANVVDQRLSSLTSEERAFLAQRIDELPAGGDVLGLLVLLFIVFVITDAIGVTDIFPFVHPVGSGKKR